MNAPANPNRRWVRWLKWLIVLTVSLFVIRAVVSARDQLRAEGGFSFRQLRWSWLTLSAAFYLLALFPMGLYWHRLLHVMGQRPRLLETLRAYYAGHLGKYVPGKAMVVVIRTALLHQGQVDSAVAAVSVFAETLTMMAVGAFLAALILSIFFASHVGLLLLAIFLMLLSGVPTWPPVFRFLVRRFRVSVIRPNVESALERFTWRVMFQGWAANAVGWGIMGLSYWAVLKALPIDSPLDPWYQLWPRLTASVSLAVVAGFLSLLPGGLGVRELVLDELMTEPFGSMTALVSAILLRFVWLLAELSVSVILYIESKMRRSTL